MTTDVSTQRSGATCAIASDGDLEGIIIIHGVSYTHIPSGIYESLLADYMRSPLRVTYQTISTPASSTLNIPYLWMMLEVCIVFHAYSVPTAD